MYVTTGRNGEEDEEGFVDVGWVTDDLDVKLAAVNDVNAGCVEINGLFTMSSVTLSFPVLTFILNKSSFIRLLPAVCIVADGGGGGGPDGGDDDDDS